MIELDAAQAAQLDLFVSELRRRGERTNLVGSLAPEALAEHVRDSLAGAAQLPRNARVVDLGSGAGLPGVPIAIARPDLTLCLVEIRERRVHFLRHVARVLGIGLEIRRVSLDEPPAGAFDVALARAVAEPGEMCDRARPWVVAGGEIWIWAGPSAKPVSGEPLESIPLGSRGEILRRLRS